MTYRTPLASETTNALVTGPGGDKWDQMRQGAIGYIIGYTEE